MQSQSPLENTLSVDHQKITVFTERMKGVFYFLSSISIIVIMSMFIFVWQPIWTDGFRDFHTVSQAINKLNNTAKPSSDAIPTMLEEMHEMTTTMKLMHKSMLNLEKISPEITKMSETMDRMNETIETHMGTMVYSIDKIENKFSPRGMMPHNW